MIALKIWNCIQTSNKVRYILLTHPTRSSELLAAALRYPTIFEQG